MSQHFQTKEFTPKWKLWFSPQMLYTDPDHQSSLYAVTASWLLLSIVTTPHVSVGFAYIPILCKWAFWAWQYVPTQSVFWRFTNVRFFIYGLLKPVSWPSFHYKCLFKVWFARAPLPFSNPRNCLPFKFLWMQILPAMSEIRRRKENIFFLLFLHGLPYSLSHLLLLLVKSQPLYDSSQPT